MKIRWLVLALLVSMSGAALAHDHVVDPNNPDTTINRDRLWNPFLGTKPWQQPLGYRVATGHVHDANCHHDDHDKAFVTTGTQSLWENCNDQNHDLKNHDAHPGAHMH